MHEIYLARDEHPPAPAQRLRDNQCGSEDGPINQRTGDTRAEDHAQGRKRKQGSWTRGAQRPTTQMADEKTPTISTAASMEKTGLEHGAPCPQQRRQEHVKTPQGEHPEQAKEREPAADEEQRGSRPYKIQRRDGPEMPHPEEETMQQRGYTPELYTRTLTANTANRMHMEPRKTRETMGTDDAHEHKTRSMNQARTAFTRVWYRRAPISGPGRSGATHAHRSRTHTQLALELATTARERGEARSQTWSGANLGTQSNVGNAQVHMDKAPMNKRKHHQTGDATSWFPDEDLDGCLRRIRRSGDDQGSGPHIPDAHRTSTWGQEIE